MTDIEERIAALEEIINSINYEKLVTFLNATSDKKWSEFDEATTINSTDILAIVQSGINKKITEFNASKSFNPGQSNIVYRRSNGSDSNDGLAIERAVATFGQAITIGGVLQPVTIVCDDQSTAIEDITIPTGIDINAPEVIVDGKITIDSTSTSDYHNIILKDLNGELSIENLLGKVKVVINDEIIGDTNEDAITNYADALVLYTSQVTPQGTGKAYVGKSESQIFAFIDSRWNGDVDLEAGATNKTNFHIEGNCNIIGNITAADKTKYRAIVNGDFNGNITTTGTGIVEITCWEKTGGTINGNNITIKELKALGTFETPGGFIDGGIISVNNPVTPTFNVSQYIGRFMDFSDSLNPIDYGKITIGAKTGIIDLYPAYPSSYIFYDHEGNITQETDPSQLVIQVSQGKHFIGSLLHSGGFLVVTANGKVPYADRAAIVFHSGFAKLTPYNEGDNSVSPNVDDDKSIDVSAGKYWQLTININYNRDDPGRINSVGATKATVYHVWKNNLGQLISEAPINQIDNTRYNPGGSSATLVAVPTSDPWVNMPVIYIPASNVYLVQYATASYSTAADAFVNQKGLIRFPELAGTSICGFLRVHKSATTFVTQKDVTPIGVFFDAGEYLAYQVGAGGAGGSVGAILPDQKNKLYNGKHGLDINNGKKIETAFLTPNATYTAASITSRSSTNRIVTEVTDNGYYSSVNLQINHDYIDTAAPYATFDGGSGTTINIQAGVTDDNFIHVKRLQNNSTSATLTKNNSALGTTNLNIGSVYNAGDGLAVSLVAPCEGIIGNVASEKTDNTSVRLSQATPDDFYCLYLQNVEGDILCEGNPKGSVIIGRQNGGTLKLPTGGVDLTIFDIASLPENNIVYFQDGGYLAVSNVQGRFINEAVDSPTTAIAIAATKSPAADNRYVCKSFDNADYESFATQSYIDIEMAGNINSATTTTIAGTTKLKARNVKCTGIGIYAITKGSDSSVAFVDANIINGNGGIDIPQGTMYVNAEFLTVNTPATQTAINIQSGATGYIRLKSGSGKIVVASGATAYLDIDDVSNFTFNFNAAATIHWKSQPQKTYVKISGDYGPGILTTDEIIGVTDTSVSRTITIPTADIQSARGGAGRRGIVKDESGGASTNNITVKGQSGNINGQASIPIAEDYGAIAWYSDGDNLWTQC